METPGQTFTSWTGLFSMGWPERASHKTPAFFWRRRRLVICVVGVVAIVVLSLYGRGILALCARQMAARQMNAGAISEAQQWLSRAAWADPGDGNVELMQAVCYRRLGQMDRWREALQFAKQKDAPAVEIQRENELGLVRSGRFPDGVETRLVELAEAAVSPHDVAEAFVYGYLARGEQDKARAFLDGWEASYPNAVHVAHLWGVYWRSQGEHGRAMTRFEGVLLGQSRHEPSRTAIAELFEAQNRLDQAFEQYVELVTRSPESEAGLVGLSRVLRKLGRVNDARTVLKPVNSDLEPPSDVAVEMGWVELASGNCEEAERWFEQADVDHMNDGHTLPAAATALALAGKTIRAERLFDRLASATSASTRMYDLGERLVIDPHDRQAADELKRLSIAASAISDNRVATSTEEGTGDGKESLASSGPELFARYCSACHGEGGDGNGRAARHLFPRPRDFRTGRFLLVSTRNGVPTLDDLMSGIERGMPGTSMRSYDELSEDQRNLLAQEVLRQHREGIRDQFVDMLRREGEIVDEAEVRAVVEHRAIAGEVATSPKIGPLDSQSVTSGKDTYFELGCNKCHGDDGIGTRDLLLYDDKRRAARPRDLVHEPFKGGSEPESIYLRITVGMPGSPHPSAGNLAQQQLIDLVQYCRSLSKEPKRLLTNHQQAILGTGRAYREALGGSGKVE